jgi:hypothetical protein
MAVVIAIEEKFDLVMPDEEAMKIRTMGQLYDYVFSRVARDQAQVCVTSAAFYRLRRALMEVCGVPRERVRTQARLEDLVPLHDRWRYWQALRARLSNLHLPPLRRPPPLAKLLEVASMIPLALMVLCTLVAVGVLAHTPAAPLVLGVMLLACPVVGVVGMFLVCHVACGFTERYAVHIPAGCATVRDMVYTLVMRHPAAPMVSDTARASDREIWGTLCTIVGSEFGREPASFTRDSNFT